MHIGRFRIPDPLDHKESILISKYMPPWTWYESKLCPESAIRVLDLLCGDGEMVHAWDDAAYQGVYELVLLFLHPFNPGGPSPGD